MSVYNYMEVIVEDVLEEVIASCPGLCQCDQCLNDIKAIALNSLKPCYISSEKGELFSRANELNRQHKVDVYKAITAAIDIVKEKPKHG